MGGYDFELMDGEEAKKFMAILRKKAAETYDPTNIESKQFKQMWDNKPSISIQYDEDNGAIYCQIDW